MAKPETHSFRVILRSAIRETMKRDSTFTGTAYAIALRSGLKHQQITNLRSGKTKPWELRVKTMQALCETLHGLNERDFYMPGRERVKEGLLPPTPTELLIKRIKRRASGKQRYRPISETQRAAMNRKRRKTKRIRNRELGIKKVYKKKRPVGRPKRKPFVRMQRPSKSD